MHETSRRTRQAHAGGPVTTTVDELVDVDKSSVYNVVLTTKRAIKKQNSDGRICGVRAETAKNRNSKPHFGKIVNNYPNTHNSNNKSTNIISNGRFIRRSSKTCNEGIFNIKKHPISFVVTYSTKVTIATYNIDGRSHSQGKQVESATSSVKS